MKGELYYFRINKNELEYRECNIGCHVRTLTSETDYCTKMLLFYKSVEHVIRPHSINNIVALSLSWKPLMLLSRQSMII